MAILRSKDIREMNAAEIKKKFSDLNEELMKERSVTSSGGVSDSPGKRREIKRTIARIKTIQKEKTKK